MAEFTLKRRKAKTLTVHIDDQSYKIPLSGSNQWIVLLKLSGGSGTIASGDVHALISGQGMAGEGGGNYKSITVSEVFPGYMLAAQSVEIGHFFTDVSVSAPAARPQGIDQMFRGIELRRGLLGLSDFQADLVVVTDKLAAASENTTD